jgi:hypothetical protein
MKMAHLASLRRSFPTLRLMAVPFRWIVKSRRRAWCVVLILLSMMAAPPLWWATELMGLPDIGDPFDVEAFRAKTIPDDRNAFVRFCWRRRGWRTKATWPGHGAAILLTSAQSTTSDCTACATGEWLPRSGTTCFACD